MGFEDSGEKAMKDRRSNSRRRLFRLIGRVLGAPAIILAFHGLVILGVNHYRNDQKNVTLVPFDQGMAPKKESRHDSPQIKVVVSAAAKKLREADASKVKVALQEIGDSATANLTDAFDVALTGQESFSEVAGRIAIMEILTDENGPRWIREVASKNPDWFLWLGLSYGRRMQYPDWLRCAQIAQKHARRLGDVSKEAESLVAQGACLIHGWGNVDGAEILFDKAQEVLGKQGSPRARLCLLKERIRARIKVYDYEEALALSNLYLDQVWASSDHLVGPEKHLALAEGYELQGIVYREADRVEKAMEIFECAQSHADRWKPSPTAPEASIIDEIGQTHEYVAAKYAGAGVEQSLLELALERYLESLEYSRAIQKDRGVAFESLACGRILVRLGRAREALPYLREAAMLYGGAYYQANGLGQYFVPALIELGLALESVGRQEEARGHFTEALRVVEDGVFKYNIEKQEALRDRLHNLLAPYISGEDPMLVPVSQPSE